MGQSEGPSWLRAASWLLVWPEGPPDLLITLRDGQANLPSLRVITLLGRSEESTRPSCNSLILPEGKAFVQHSWGGQRARQAFVLRFETFKGPANHPFNPLGRSEEPATPPCLRTALRSGHKNPLNLRVTLWDGQRNLSGLRTCCVALWDGQRTRHAFMRCFGTVRGPATPSCNVLGWPVDLPGLYATFNVRQRNLPHLRGKLSDCQLTRHAFVRRLWTGRGFARLARNTTGRSDDPRQLRATIWDGQRTRQAFV